MIHQTRNISHYFLLLSLFCWSCKCDNNDDNDILLKGKLEFAQVLFRHGDRTIIESYPKDPWRDPKYWPEGWGQLTKSGEMQLYKLGAWLRNRYKHLLNDTYNTDKIYIRSTDVDRTLMSAEANLAGLFPPDKNQRWDDNINWQPIPVHTVPEHLDEVLSGMKSCPAYKYEFSALKKTKEFLDLDEKFGNLYKYLSLNTGKKIKSLENVLSLNNTLFIEDLNNFTLPEWTKSVYPGGDMKWIADFSFSVPTYTTKLARLKIGPLIKEIFQRFKDKVNSKLKPNRSLWMYSAHDLTVGNLLNSLKLFDHHSPPYAACVLVELRIHNNEPFISVFYKRYLDELNPPPLIIPNCGRFCPLNKMFDLYSDILPIDWEKECKMSTLLMTYEEANIGPAMAILVVFTSTILLLILLYTAILYFKRRSYFDYTLHLDIE